MGWNVTETAARLGCERGTLSRLLSGKAGVSANMAPALEDIGWGYRRTLDAAAGELRLAQARRDRTTAERRMRALPRMDRGSRRRCGSVGQLIADNGLDAGTNPCL